MSTGALWATVLLALLAVRTAFGDPPPMCISDLGE